MAEIRWYKVWMVVPGTDGDAENGPCEPMWWNDMEQALFIQKTSIALPKLLL